MTMLTCRSSQPPVYPQAASEHANQRISMRACNARYSARPSVGVDRPERGEAKPCEPGGQRLAALGSMALKFSLADDQRHDEFHDCRAPREVRH